MTTDGKVIINDRNIAFLNLKITGGIVRQPQIKGYGYAGRTPARRSSLKALPFTRAMAKLSAEATPQAKLLAASQAKSTTKQASTKSSAMRVFTLKIYATTP